MSERYWPCFDDRDYVKAHAAGDSGSDFDLRLVATGVTPERWKPALKTLRVNADGPVTIQLRRKDSAGAYHDITNALFQANANKDFKLHRTLGPWVAGMDASGAAWPSFGEGLAYKITFGGGTTQATVEAESGRCV